ncbi:MAG TPA: ABC transporter permease, partial [Candidatus Eisenbacteria bacterium]|nr:ABC transporter permease [Candidatus Eisenbacteria bacterium]
MPALIRSLLVRLHALFHRSTIDRELDEELQQHLERETVQNLARGMSERDAKDAAGRDLGSMIAHREAGWEAFGWTWLEQLGQDVRYGWRVLLRDRGFTVITILILALGIGASTALFAAINGVLLRPLPYRQPDRLVAAWESNPNKLGARAGTSASAFTAWAERSRTFDGFAAYRPWGFDLTGAANPERVQGARVSGNLFSLLGAPPLLGRALVPEDGLPGRPKVTLLSEEFWQRRFGADAGILGASLVLNGDSYTVVGVLPRGFTLPKAELWVPLTFAPYEIDQRGDRPLSVIGRLRPGTDITAAREEMQAIARVFEGEFPISNAGWSVAMAYLKEDLTGAVRTPLVLLLVAAFCVLLVACANVTNLLL